MMILKTLDISLNFFYFTISLVTDPIQIEQYFRSDFVHLVMPAMQQYISQYPDVIENQLTSFTSYHKLVSSYVGKIRQLIEILKQNGLWIPHGSSQFSENPTELITKVLDAEVIELDHMFYLRYVKVSALMLTPELTLYYNACLKCCQSQVAVIRLYSYSLLRSAPGIADIRHSFSVFKEALIIWASGSVSFEFNASLYLLLVRFQNIGFHMWTKMNII